jgi:hypothetical protein
VRPFVSRARYLTQMGGTFPLLLRLLRHLNVELDILPLSKTLFLYVCMYITNHFL